MTTGGYGALRSGGLTFCPRMVGRRMPRLEAAFLEELDLEARFAARLVSESPAGHVHLGDLLTKSQFCSLNNAGNSVTCLRGLFKD